MYEGVDTVILNEELAYQDQLPVAWRALPKPLDLPAVTSLTERNVRILQLCAAIEEQGMAEKKDDKTPHAADLMRLEIKVNLLLELMGQLLAVQQPRPAATAVRFNALAVVWKATQPLPRVGDKGLLDIYLRDGLPQPLSLLVNVTQVAADQVKAAVTPPGETVADLLEKLAFRQHRRQVAGTRQPRRAGSETGITRTLG
jgi:hypothetical protein